MTSDDKKIAVHWFRQDLRLSDNPALTQAAKCEQVLPIYIFDHTKHDDAIGAASRCWLQRSLTALQHALKGNLSVYCGNPCMIFHDMIKRFTVEAVYWNQSYDPYQRQIDNQIKDYLKKQGVSVQIYQGTLLWEPWMLLKKDGTPYRVFTPFYHRACLQAVPPRQPLSAPKKVQYVFDKEQCISIDELKLLPNIRWDISCMKSWIVGEIGAYKRLKAFIHQGLACYKDGHHFPDKPYVSRLSPYLHFGEISPNQIWYMIRCLGDNKDIDHFCRELCWREFAHHQLYHYPDLPKKNLRLKFDAFPWRKHSQFLEAWQQGRTGVPMVDAGMRELWQTGYLHNRQRMIVGSFLVKNLLIHWHHGAQWFWETLFDADLANNSVGWQWIAGCGIDAAPYFRIFNPVNQGKRFDPDGHYIRRYIPEIAKLPNAYLFSPWEAPERILKEAGITLGMTYPKPLIDLKKSRQAALKAFNLL